MKNWPCATLYSNPNIEIAVCPERELYSYLIQAYFFSIPHFTTVKIRRAHTDENIAQTLLLI